METIEYTFGKGFDMKKALHAMMEEDEDVIVDENGETISDLALTMGWADQPTFAGIDLDTESPIMGEAV